MPSRSRQLFHGFLQGGTMFRGRYEHAIDAKGRTSFPSRFREALSQAGDDRVVLTTGLDPCVVAYPMREWVAFEERLAALPQFDATVATLRRIVVSGAVDCDLDKMGRLLVPPTLREHAVLEREVIWAGMGRHIELWDKAAFASMQKAALEDDANRVAMASRLAELGL